MINITTGANTGTTQAANTRQERMPNQNKKCQILMRKKLQFPK